MIGPLSTTYAGQMALTATDASILVATPILVLVLRPHGLLGKPEVKRV